MTIPIGTAVTTEGVAIRNVSKRFGDGADAVVALDDVSLDIPRGRFVSLVGPSGCGKSTLLRLLANLDTPTSGNIELLGHPPEQATSHKLIGLVPQAPALLPWRTVVENVHLPFELNAKQQHNVDGERLDPLAVLAEVGLGDALDRKPVELSGGMQQRVAIARAFCFGAPILLMDEPFSALDEFTRESVQTQLLELWRRHTKTIVFVTHSVREAVLMSDTVVVMSARPGRITATIDVGVERPRNDLAVEQSAEFQGYIADVKTALKDGWR